MSSKTTATIPAQDPTSLHLRTTVAAANREAGGRRERLADSLRLLLLTMDWLRQGA